MDRVLLVNMPFSSLRWPSLGLGLLKAGLSRQGIPCDVAYWNFDLAESIGLELYDWINDSFAFVQGGEWLFSRLVHPAPAGLPDAHAYRQEVLQPSDPAFTDQDLQDLLAISGYIEPFLDNCLRQFDWRFYPIVGFSATFQQLLASLAAARKIKELAPNLTICLGGAHCEGPMGPELLRQYPQLDFVFSGEADDTFPALCQRLLSGQPPGRLPGVHRKEQPTTPQYQTPPSPEVPPIEPCFSPNPPAARVPNLDLLPFPDFSDYFSRLEKSSLAAHLQPLLVFETARGCWWGQKNPCTFCGLNGEGLAFRAKSPARAVRELVHLRKHYNVRQAVATDNILDFHSFKTFLPTLKEAQLDLDLKLELEYELKTNLTTSQIQALKDAGLVAAQLGMESLSTPVLKIMRKGVTALQNVQTLKWFAAAGIEAKWNFLYGFPGETQEDYQGLAELLPALFHLMPPQACGPVRIDRFSPYHRNPAAFGLGTLRPHPAYRFLHPFGEESLARLAYYFVADQGATTPEPPAFLSSILDTIEDWRKAAGRATFHAIPRPDRDGLVLLDTRPCAPCFQRGLSGAEMSLYLYCDSGRTYQRLLQFAEQAGLSIEPPDLQRMLDRWVNDRMAVLIDGRYLSLALLDPSLQPQSDPLAASTD